MKKVDVWCGFSIILSWRDFQKFPPKVSASATVTGSAPSVGLVFARPKGASTKKNTKDAGVPPHYSFDTLILGEVDANTTTCHTPAVYTLARANIDASPWPNLHFGICVGPCLRAITRRTMNQLNLKIIAWMGENSLNPNLNESTCEESLQASGLFFEYRISTKRTLDDGLVLGTVRISKAWTNGRTDERTNERTNEWMKKRKNDELIMNESPTSGKCGPLLKPGLFPKHPPNEPAAPKSVGFKAVEKFVVHNVCPMGNFPCQGWICSKV